MNKEAFQKIIYDYYEKNKRQFPWRDVSDPYFVMVSEIMLQQTQTSRVVQKYKQFIKRFPTVSALVSAPLIDVLQMWQGLGYNRRGKYLKEAAEIIVKKFDSKVPNEMDKLTSLPGIAEATAGAIIAYAFNKPAVFIETNIRAVFLYFFFPNESSVSDKTLYGKVEEMNDSHRPRDWYYALTDYGVMLKNKQKFQNIQSRHYAKQTKFEGSNRQVRGAIMKYLTSQEYIDEKDLYQLLSFDKQRVKSALDSLVKEKMVVVKKEKVSIIQ